MQWKTVWWFDASRLAEALAVRDAATRIVADVVPEIESGPVWTVLTELITNVARHAPGHAELRLELDHGCAIVHVLDRGFRRLPPIKLPENPLSECGRGLFIVRELSHSFQLRRRPSGGTHAVAVLRSCSGEVIRQTSAPMRNP